MVDYQFYVNNYLGTLSEHEFKRSLVRASAHIERITFGRAKEFADTNEVKYALCTACDVIAQEDGLRKKYGGRNVVSENNDGYSVSYVCEQQEGMTAESYLGKKISDAVAIYLEPTGLLSWEVYST